MKLKNKAPFGRDGDSGPEFGETTSVTSEARIPRGHRVRMHGSDPGPQTSAFVRPADSVMPGLWDVFTGSRVYLGTFSTRELSTATAELYHVGSGRPWRVSDDPRFSGRRRKGNDKASKKSAAVAARQGRDRWVQA